MKNSTFTNKSYFMRMHLIFMIISVKDWYAMEPVMMNNLVNFYLFTMLCNIFVIQLCYFSAIKFILQKQTKITLFSIDNTSYENAISLYIQATQRNLQTW